MTNESKQRRSSRLPGFYKLPLAERAATVAQWAGLNRDDQAVLLGLAGLNATQADHLIENVIGVHALPLGVATNFLVNGQDYLIPMVVEEPSIVAGVSFAARLARGGGGFIATADDPVMIGQIQVLDVDNVYAAAGRVWEARERLLEDANCCDRVMVKLGGGARGLELRPFPDTPAGAMLVIHVLLRRAWRRSAAGECICASSLTWRINAWPARSVPSRWRCWVLENTHPKRFAMASLKPGLSLRRILIAQQRTTKAL